MTPISSARPMYSWHHSTSMADAFLIPAFLNPPERVTMPEPFDYQLGVSRSGFNSPPDTSMVTADKSRQTTPASVITWL
jgi:hypothetical protein